MEKRRIQLFIAGLAICMANLYAQEKSSGDALKLVGSDPIIISGNYEYALLREVYSNGVNSGTLRTHQWNHRTLNEIQVLGTSDNWISLNAGKITLDKGIYRIQASVSTWRTSYSRLRMAGFDENNAIIEKSVQYSIPTYNHPDGYAGVPAQLLVYLILDEETTFELQQMVSTVNDSNHAKGLRVSNGTTQDFGPEIFATLEVLRFTEN